jgi:outer membrane protein
VIHPFLKESPVMSTTSLSPVRALLLVTLLLPAATAAQPRIQNPSQTTTLDLEMALRLALSGSWRMERVRLDLERDQFNLEANRAALKSNASLAVTLPNYDQSIKEITDPDTGNPKLLSTQGARYSANLSIRQPLPTNGVVSLNGVWNRTQDQLFSYTPGLKSYNSKFFVRFDQPILQPNAIQLNIRRAELRLEETQIRFLNEQIDAIGDVTRAYFVLYQRTYEDLLAGEEVTRLERSYAIGRRRFQAGSLTEIDLLQLEVDLADRRNRSSSATGRLGREKSSFKQMVGLGLDVPIDLEIETTYTPVEIDEALAIRRALDQRTEVRQNQISKEYNEMDLKERRSWGAVRGTVSLTLGLEGRGSEMDQLYDALLDPDQTRGAAVNFNIPLWDWGRNRAQVSAKMAEIRKVDRALDETRITIEREVRDVVDRVAEAQRRLEMLVPSVNAAERSFRLSLERFEEGSLNTQDLILTQNRLADARRSYLSAFLDYKGALSDLQRRTFWDWERDQPLTATLAALLNQQE